MDSAAFLANVHGSAPASVPSDARAVEALYSTGYMLLERARVADAAHAFRVMLRAAPRDERAWLALGACHERIDQLNIALELYGMATVAAAPAVRCQLARARLLRVRGSDDQADDALDEAAEGAATLDDSALIELVASERRRAS